MRPRGELSRDRRQDVERKLEGQPGQPERDAQRETDADGERDCRALQQAPAPTEEGERDRHDR